MIGQMPEFAPDAVTDRKPPKKACSTRMNCVLFGEPITYLAVTVGLFQAGCNGSIPTHLIFS